MLDQPDLIDTETSVMGKFYEASFRQPGRHVSLLHHLSHLFGPLFDIGVRQQVERCGLVWTMAIGAMLKNDRRNVFVESQRAVLARDILFR